MGVVILRVWSKGDRKGQSPRLGGSLPPAALVVTSLKGSYVPVAISYDLKTPRRID